MRRIKNMFKYHLYVAIVEFILSFFPNTKRTNRIRGSLFKPLFKSCGKNFQLAKNVTINMHRNIIIGDNVYIAHNCWINGSGGLTFKDNVIVSPNVIIATTKHKYLNGAISNKYYEQKEIIINEGTWIAGNSTVVLDVNIGKGNIIAAGSVVTKDTKAFALYAGVPAKFIKDLN